MAGSCIQQMMNIALPLPSETQDGSEIVLPWKHPLGLICNLFTYLLGDIHWGDKTMIP